jgi:hypothetical protein
MSSMALAQKELRNPVTIMPAADVHIWRMKVIALGRRTFSTIEIWSMVIFLILVFRDPK